MKLSIIIQNSAAGHKGEKAELIKKIISQLTDDCELIITTQGSRTLFKEFKADNVKVVKQKQNDCYDFKNALKVAQGEFVTFIFEGDDVCDNYVECLLETIEDGENAYYPIMWQHMGWHGLSFIGCNPLLFWFANAYKKSFAQQFLMIDGTNDLLADALLYQMLQKYESGAPTKEIIYKRWR